MKKTILYTYLFLVHTLAFSQSKFQFQGDNIEKQEISFKLINNLIVIPLEINDHKLSFILDTGVNKTILFNAIQNDSIRLNNVNKFFVRGLGSGEPIEVLASQGNRFRIKNILGSNQEIYVVLKDSFNLSAKMGETIHGIIGYDLLKDLIVKINYSTKKITFYNPETYKEKKCRKCETFPLEFYKNKPYIDVEARIDTVNNITTPVKLLIDTGGSDAMWLFEGSKKNIKTPIKYFKDVLGEGMSGTIYGNRSRIPYLSLGKFIVKEPTVSFLDSISTLNARQFKERNGSIGGNILKRFKVWIDYPNKKFTLKKNASLKQGFFYNMSGLHVVYDGKELVKEIVKSKKQFAYGEEKKDNTIISFVNSYHYKFKPRYKVSLVVEGSPAYKAGVLQGDSITHINGIRVYEYSLEEITFLFQSKPNKKIKLSVKRGGLDLKFEFKLEKRI